MTAQPLARPLSHQLEFEVNAGDELVTGLQPYLMSKSGPIARIEGREAVSPGDRGIKIKKTETPDTAQQNPSILTLHRDRSR